MSVSTRRWPPHLPAGSSPAPRHAASAKDYLPRPATTVLAGPVYCGPSKAAGSSSPGPRVALRRERIIEACKYSTLAAAASSG